MLALVAKPEPNDGRGTPVETVRQPTRRTSRRRFDPTLELAPGAIPPTPPFPNVGAPPGIVLYRTEDNGLALRWELTGQGLDEAVAAFDRVGAEPLPGLRIARLHDSGGADTVASARLARLEDLRCGLARYPHPAQDGTYRAEIGLRSLTGGWLLLARSNRVDWLAARGGAESSPRRQPAVMPLLGTARQDLAPSPSPSPSPIRETGAVISRLALPGSSPAARMPQEPAPIILEPTVTPDLPAPTTPVAEVSREASGGQVRGGSGPIVSPRARPELALWGELRIEGRAAPGTVLDLGGHAYVVGNGGHFSLRVALEDRATILALLRQLPELPVAARD